MKRYLKPLLVALIDVDHTLLGPDCNLSLANLQAVQLLQEIGLWVILASGRSYHQMLSIHRMLKLTTPMICSNGGLIFWPDRSGGKILYETCLKGNETQALFSLARDRALTFYSYHREGVCVWKKNHWNGFDAGHEGKVPLSYGEPDLAKSAAQKVFLSMPSAEASKNFPLVTNLATGLFVWRGGPETIEVQPANAGKLETWRHLAKLLNIAPEQIIVFGDGDNDIPLLQSAALGVAMSNATPMAMAAAHFVSPAGPEESSFARAVSILCASGAEMLI